MAAQALRCALGGLRSTAGGFPSAARRLAHLRAPRCRSQPPEKGSGAASAEAELEPQTAPDPAAPTPAASLEEKGDDAPSEPEKQGEGFAWFDRPATPPKGPLRKTGMQAGKEGRYLESERFTTDANRLKAGPRTAPGGDQPPELPQAVPWASRSLGVGILAATFVFGYDFRVDVPDLLVPGGGPLLLTTWLQPAFWPSPSGWPEAAAGAAALLTAGRVAERLLGTVGFSAAFFLPASLFALLGVSVAYFDSPFPIWLGGSATPCVAVAAALAASTAANWGTLGQVRQRATCVASAAGLGGVGLVAGMPPIQAGLLATAGGLLGWTIGPKLVVLRELDIPAGAMTVTGNEAEVQVVVDQRTALCRWAPIGVGGALVAAWLLALPFEFYTLVEDMEAEGLSEAEQDRELGRLLQRQYDRYSHDSPELLARFLVRQLRMMAPELADPQQQQPEGEEGGEGGGEGGGRVALPWLRGMVRGKELEA